MKTRTSNLLIIPLLFCLSSCLTTANPLINFENAQAFDQCMGSWRVEGQEIKIEKFTGSRLEKELSDFFGKDPGEEKESGGRSSFINKAYLLSYNKSDIEHIMILHFTTLNGMLFAQLKPFRSYVTENGKEGKSVWEITKDGGYTIAKVSTADNRISFRFINGDQILSLKKSGKLGLRMEHDALFDNSIITASTPELKSFLHKYGSSELIFKGSPTYILEKK